MIAIRKDKRTGTATYGESTRSTAFRFPDSQADSDILPENALLEMEEY